jgi:hypothetical protein
MKDRRIFIIIGLVVLIIGLLVGIGFKSRFNKNPNDPGLELETYNAATCETISNKPNLTPETTGGDNDLLVLGLPQLIKSGVSSTQSTLVRDALKKFFSDKNLKIKGQANIEILNIRKLDTGAISAKMTYNKINYSVRVVLYPSDVVEVFVFNATNSSQLLYDSGKLGDKSDGSDSEDDNFGGDGIPPEEQ